ncbi:unnamed protein product, partial [Didymodactylos carnosus]
TSPDQLQQLSSDSLQTHTNILTSIENQIAPNFVLPTVKLSPETLATLVAPKRARRKLNLDMKSPERPIRQCARYPNKLLSLTFP